MKCRPLDGGRALRAFLVLIFVVAAVAPAHAQVEQRLEGLAPADLFALADQARAAGRSNDAAALYDALAGDPDLDVRAEARFRKGMMYAEQHRYTDAAIAFRAVLDERPDAVRARLELARMLALLGDERAAQREVRQAQASGLPEDVALTVEQFARALRSNQLLGGSVELALAPDSNVNRATQARTLDTVVAPLTLSGDARARSGIGARVAAQGFARIPLSPRLSLLPRFAGAGSLYRAAQFNDVSASTLLGLEWRSGADRVSASVGQTWRWYGGQPYARTVAASLDWLHPLGLKAQLVLHGGASRADYQRNDLQDGDLFDVSVGVEQALDARSGVGVALNGYRQTARDPGYATVSGGASTFAWQEVGKATLVISAAVSRLEGDARLLLFRHRRREWLARAGASATFRGLQVAGFAPGIRIDLERNWSTVGLYDYRRVAGAFTIARAL